MFVEWFMRDELPGAVEEARTTANSESIDDALEFIKDTLERFHLFQGHRMRVVNQRRSITEICVFMERVCLLSEQDGMHCIIVIDWKMKFEAIRFRESATRHFGKRGVSWHEAVIIFFKCQSPCEENNFQAKAIRTQKQLWIKFLKMETSKMD